MNATPHAYPPSDIEIARIYNDACSHGRVVLKSSQGSLVSFRTLPSEIRQLLLYDSRSRVVSETYVRYRSPASTFLAVRQMDAPREGMLTADCRVISNRIERQTAISAMSLGMEEVQPRAVGIEAAYNLYWTADSPTRGVRRKVRFDDTTGWTVMTTETYRILNGDQQPQQKVSK